jgi:hypothetical protein
LIKKFLVVFLITNEITEKKAREGVILKRRRLETGS